MMNLRFSFHEVLLAALMALMLLPCPVLADEDDEDDSAAESMSILPATPAWLSQLDATGRYVGVRGSESKFREDHNIRSGADIGARIDQELDDGQILFFQGLGQLAEEQGFARFDYGKPGGLSFKAQLQAWTEFYNARPGVKNETAFGTRINGSGIFPNTTDSRSIFGGGKPSVDWLTTTAGVDFELPGAFHDGYADFTYRKIKGEMSLLKGSTVSDPLAPPSPGSGPGTVSFDFPGRKDVNYETLGGQIGSRATLGGIAWRFDASAFRHEIKSETRETNFGLDAATSDAESYNEDTELSVFRVNLVGSRQVSQNLFVYGGGVVSSELSDPEPFQDAQSGILSGTTSRLRSRSTLSSDVKRFSEAFNAGLVFQPLSSVVVTADVGVRAHQDNAELVEDRNESSLVPPADTGSIINSSDREHLSLRGRADVSWKADRKLSFKGHARYRYSDDDMKSRRRFGFVVAEPDEFERYELRRHRFKIGGSGRYRLRAGRRIEAGYEFIYEDLDTDVHQLSNQFIIADYERLQHRGFAKASGRIVKKLRGELRFQYVFEERDMDAPNVDTVINPAADNGKVEFHGFTIVPTLTYQHSATLSGYLSGSVGRQKYELDNAGTTPTGFGSTFSSFEYEVVTETATFGINWSPMERVSGSATYTFFNSSDSVRNTGHDLTIRGAFEIDEDWDLTSGLRYLGYDPASNTLDDYNTIIFTLGMVGRF